MKNSTYKKLFDFYQNEQGVYTILTALISFVLLGIIALAVDGSGMLLDKARLSQGLEQGALALTTEANKPRVSHNDDLSKHKYFNSQKGTSSSKAAGKTNAEIKAYERDQQLLKGYVQSYLPDAKLPRDFQYDCQEQFTPKRVIGCWAQGDIDRPSWLPLNNTSLTFKKEEKIASEQVYVGKNLDDVAPLDLMLVTDLSGSMKENGNNNQSKISILREVVKEISEELLDNPKERKDISPYNRISFTSFAFGASQQNNNQCYLPYELTPEGQKNLFKTLINISEFKSWYYRWGRDYGSRPLFDTWKWWIKTGERNDEISYKLYKKFLETLEKGIDYNKTVSNITNFTGKSENYPLMFEKNSWCLGGNNSATTSKKWYEKDQSKDLTTALAALQPSGATLSSSGLLIGANLLMNKNDKPAAQPQALRINTQRILLVLSDGRDEIYKRSDPAVTYWKIPEELKITTNLINKDMCKAITKKLNELQNSAYPQKPTQIHFVAFGYVAEGEQKRAWEKCVGKNYHHASNKEQLLDTFKQIVGLQEEVGHVAPRKVF